MIINIGGRTDIVNYYSEWLMNRIHEGFCYVRNPYYPEIVYRYDLSPDKVDFLLMCSKNYRPILKYIDELNEKYRLICHYTITPYGKDIEPNVLGINETIDTLIKLSKKIGKEKVIWRYDPLLLTKRYDVAHLIRGFEYIASKVSNYINKVVFSFVEVYKKLEINFPELIPFTIEEKEQLLTKLGEIAKKYNLKIQTCGCSEDYTRFGINISGCTTLSFLEDTYGIKYKDKREGKLREGCNCLITRDIGMYSTCLNGCKYCYANKSYKNAVLINKYHDPNSPMLIGNIKENDVIKNVEQKSYI